MGAYKTFTQHAHTYKITHTHTHMDTHGDGKRSESVGRPCGPLVFWASFFHLKLFNKPKCH